MYKLVIKKGKFNFLFLLGMFIIIYNPPFLPVNSMHIVGLLSIFYLLVNYNWSNICLAKPKILGMIIMLLVTFCYVALVVAFNNGKIQDVLFPVYFLIDIIPFSLALCIKGKKTNASCADYINLFIFVAFIQAVLALLAFFIKPVQLFFVDKLVNYGYTTLNEFSSHRLYGFASELTFSASIFQAIISVIVLVKSVEENRLFKKVFLIFVSIVLLFSGVINARSALVVYIVGSLSFIFCNKFSIKRKLIFFLEIGIIILLAVFFVYPLISNISVNTYDWIKEGTEEIVNFFQGKTEDGYFSYITNKNRYKLPENIVHFIFGCGTRIMGGKYIYSDIGFINDVWLGGIFYLLCVYTLIVYMSIVLSKFNNKIISYLGFFFIFLMPVINFKGIVVSMNSVMNFYIIIYSIILVIDDVKAKDISINNIK